MPCQARFVLLVVVLLALGCDRGRKQSAPESSGSPAPTLKPIPKGTACDSLSRTQCFRSDHCFLDWQAPTKYSCRARKGPCELGLHQADRAGCEQRAQCEWRSPSCYCPFPGYGDTAVPEPPGAMAGGACGCGGGAPPMCVLRQ